MCKCNNRSFYRFCMNQAKLINDLPSQSAACLWIVSSASVNTKTNHFYFHTELMENHEYKSVSPLVDRSINNKYLFFQNHFVTNQKNDMQMKVQTNKEVIWSFCFPGFGLCNGGALFSPVSRVTDPYRTKCVRTQAWRLGRDASWEFSLRSGKTGVFRCFLDAKACKRSSHVQRALAELLTRVGWTRGAPLRCMSGCCAALHTHTHTQIWETWMPNLAVPLSSAHSRDFHAKARIHSCARKWRSGRGLFPTPILLNTKQIKLLTFIRFAVGRREIWSGIERVFSGKEEKGAGWRRKAGGGVNEAGTDEGSRWSGAGQCQGQRAAWGQPRLRPHVHTHTLFNMFSIKKRAILWAY